MKETRTEEEIEEQRVINHQTYQCVLVERRLMYTATIATSLSILLFVAAVASTDWAYIEFVAPPPHVDTHITVHLGIWGEWRNIHNATSTDELWIPHFPQPPKHISRLSNYDLPHYYRAQAVFAAISILLMVPVNMLACYTFKAYRYTFKRLVACIHALIAFCMVVINEVLAHSTNQWKSSSTQSEGQPKPPSSDAYSAGHTYGWATYAVWFVCAVHVAAAGMFVAGGRKRKGSYAATEVQEFEDRPVITGR